MRILHAADLHFRRDRYEEARASIDAMCAEHDERPVDLFALAGDLWDGPVQNTAGSRFGDFLALVRRLAMRAPVAIIYGTPTHDAEGSLDVFEALEATYPIRILKPGRPYFLTSDGLLAEDRNTDSFGKDRLLLLGVPEPNKKWLLAGAGATGKDATDAFARDAMRALFLGLGGLRKEHSDLPCILLYHGQVVGAKSATGFGVESGAGLAVTRDDLASVGADYIALGDIHEPQQIPGLPAYYPGSIYPINWGETHKAGANLVEIGASAADDLFAHSAADVVVSRLNFPHPVRMKLSVGDARGVGAELPKVPAMIWYDIACTREEAERIDVEALTAQIIAHGALPGSRVTLNIAPTETVRAGEIQEKVSLRDKIQVWAENSSTAVSMTALAKADELEREAAARGDAAQGAHIRIDRLRLRGAIGIWKKSRKDEIDLDLEALGPGVIGLVGGNGEGKTTILENLHPWPAMLTRAGALKDHFRLKDSCRDLYFTDERTGIRYRALIQIRADIASGAAEYFLSADRGQGFEPLPGSDGRLKSYEAQIAELFGSQELYLRTAFVTQRPTKLAPDLAEATQGQRKALFGELAGIDYLERYREAAKARGDALRGELVRLEGLLAAAGDIEAQIAEETAIEQREDGRAAEAQREADASATRGRAFVAERDELSAQVARAELRRQRAAGIQAELADLSSLEAQIAELERTLRENELAAQAGRGEAEHAERRATDLKAERDRLAEEVSALTRKADRSREIREEVESLLIQVQVAEREIESFRAAEGRREAAERELAQLRELEEKLATLRTEKAKHDAEVRRLLEAHQAAAQEAESRRRVAQAGLDASRARLSVAERELAAAEARLTAPIEDHCPTCHQLLPEERREHLIKERGKLEAERDGFAQTRAGILREVMELEQALAGIAQPEPPALPGFDRETEIHEAERALDWLDRAEAEATLQRATAAAAQIASLTAKIEEARARAAALSDQVDETAAPRLVLARPALASQESALQAIQDRLTATKSAVAAAEAFASSARRQIEDARARAGDIAARRRDLEAELSLLGETAADLELATALERKTAEIQAEQERYAQARDAAAEARGRAEGARRVLVEARGRLAALGAAKAEASRIETELADWDLLERACGPNGIQALELDALAPSIAAVSNRLLGEAYGSRFRIEFRTTRIAGKGAKTKQVEDFEIFILDTESGDEQTIDSLSGGEAVWIRKALYDGFAIIRAKNTGTRFQTVFLDEADGALDPESRMLYLRMLEAAHRESGRYQTILITHSTELQAMVERIVRVADLGPRETMEVAA